MSRIGTQRGMSIWVLMLLVVCLAFMGLIGLKLFPVYLESYKIDRGLAALVEDPGLSRMSKREIKEALLRRLDIDSVTEVRHNNFAEVVTITKDAENVTLDIVYDVVVPIAGNLSVLAEFEKHGSNF